MSFFRPLAGIPAPGDMAHKSPPRRLFDALASLRLAVVVMVTLGATCATATFYESAHGTAAAQREFYKTGWFALILIALGVNIFCAMMSRYPWKPHHAGFVIAHIGILTLLAGSLISLRWGLDSNMALFEGETSDHVSLLERGLEAALPGQGGRLATLVDFEKTPPRPGKEQRFAIPGSDATLVAEAFEPHVQVREGFEEGRKENPAIHFLLDNPFAKEEGWLLAADPSRREQNFGPATVGFVVVDSGADAQRALDAKGGGNRVLFVATKDHVLRYGFASKDSLGPRGTVTLGSPIATPWMGMTVVVDRFLERAEGSRTVVAEAPPANDERRLPAVRVHLEEGSVRSESEWLLWTESRSVPFGSAQATLAYRSPEVQVPFRVTLLKFRSEKYPGSNMPATYESFVRVDDTDSGVSEEHHISMNNPLHYRGYIFFQASFVEGQPMMSIFSVARAPGLPLVYLGVGLIASGVAWMFYLKPYLARRQAARAAAAHRQRESAHGVQSTDPSVPSRSGPVEPASSGA